MGHFKCMCSRTSQVYIVDLEQQAGDQPFEIQAMCLCYAETKPEGNHVRMTVSTVYGASIHLMG